MTHIVPSTHEPSETDVGDALRTLLGPEPQEEPKTEDPTLLSRKSIYKPGVRYVTKDIQTDLLTPTKTVRCFHDGQSES